MNMLEKRFSKTYGCCKNLDIGKIEFFMPKYLMVAKLSDLVKRHLGCYKDGSYLFWDFSTLKDYARNRLAISNISEIILFNISGKQLDSFSVSNSKTKLNVGAYPPGYYIIVANVNDKLVTQKFIISR